MIPRGLAVAVCIGVAAGAAAGIALHGKGAPMPGASLSYVEGASLSVAVERPDYRAGEPVRIRVVNTGTAPLEFADGSYGLRVTQLDGIEVYAPRPGGDVVAAAAAAAAALPAAASPPQGPAAAAAPAVLAPREEAILVWNQTKSDGAAVLHGTYRISSAAAPLGDHAGAARDPSARVDGSVAINILR